MFKFQYKFFKIIFFGLVFIPVAVFAEQNLSDAIGGGFGGNEKVGKFTYDELPIKRDVINKICYLENDNVVIKDMRKDYSVVSYSCPDSDPQHNNVFWDDELGAINGGYSPSNDLLYAGTVISRMFEEWYHVPILQDEQGRAKKSVLIINFFQTMEDETTEEITEAIDGGEGKLFGNGTAESYPLTSFDVVAHEMAHEFTQQHSGLAWPPGDFSSLEAALLGEQAIAINEAFSDMTGQAGEFFVTGHNDWKVGKAVFKATDKSLRYMDKPSRDCLDKSPGEDCSIDNVNEMMRLHGDEEQPVMMMGRVFLGHRYVVEHHYLAGIFNRAFYLLSNSSGWDTKKAYDVMVQANMHFWKPNSTFSEAACGVIKATRVYYPSYSVDSVIQAFANVGIKNLTEC